MVALNPAPDTLGMSSPALGPWFSKPDNPTQFPAATPANDLPILALPNPDLSVSVNLNTQVVWRAPSLSLRSMMFATTKRPPALRNLRQEDGNVAFTDGSLVVLVTLMPEVELRLWNISRSDELTNPTPRPRIRYFAMEIPAASITTIADIENLLPLNYFPLNVQTVTIANYPPDVVSPAEKTAYDNAEIAKQKAAYLGLKIDGGVLVNGENETANPVSQLLKPSTDAIAGSEDKYVAVVTNRTNQTLSANFWCFDYLGRPIDPGAVADWWAWLAQDAQWENLWIDDTRTSADRVPANTVAGKTVHFVNAHLGNVPASYMSALDLDPLITSTTLIPGSSALYRLGTNPTIALTNPAPANAPPLLRLSVLPSADYAEINTNLPDPFTGGTSPTSRDFIRIALVDIESHIVGLPRTAASQQNPDFRVNVARNTATEPFLPTLDDVNEEIMNVLSVGDEAVVIAPYIDRLWGVATAPVDFGTGEIPGRLTESEDFTVHSLKGSGETPSADLSANQSIVLMFTGLPENSWIRVWPHAMDTATGHRFLQNGGAARANGNGDAYVVLPIPDGRDDGRLSFNARIQTNETERNFGDVRFDRPPISGDLQDIVDVQNIGANQTLWLCEVARMLGLNGYQSGNTILAIENMVSGPLSFVVVDETTLLPDDITLDTQLVHAAEQDDTLIITEAAFNAPGTRDGTLIDPVSSDPVIAGITVVNRERGNLGQNVAGVAVLGQPVPSQEHREVAALERTGNSAVIGGAPGRAQYHAAPPPQSGHAGVNASFEIHGPGIGFAGPITDELLPIMAEREAETLLDFIEIGGRAFTADSDDTGSVWSSVFETTAKGAAGGASMRFWLQADPNPNVVTNWANLKTDIQTLINNNIPKWANQQVTLDQIDDAINGLGVTDDNDLLAVNLQRLLLKTQTGKKDFAVTLLDAISRAEDFIYIETPALDDLAFTDGQQTNSLVQAIENRWDQRPGLCVMINIPENFMPFTNKSLERVRRNALDRAIMRLSDKAGDQLAVFSPIAGYGRGTYMASTTVIIDDVLLLCGNTHLWRRGLSFDSSLAAGLFDEAVENGHSVTVRAARRQLMATALGLADIDLVPEAPEDCLRALQDLDRIGGLHRVNSHILSNVPHASDDEMNIWNPDGFLATNDPEYWNAYLAQLLANFTQADFVNNFRDPL